MLIITLDSYNKYYEVKQPSAIQENWSDLTRHFTFDVYKWPNKVKPTVLKSLLIRSISKFEKLIWSWQGKLPWQCLTTLEAYMLHATSPQLGRTK